MLLRYEETLKIFMYGICSSLFNVQGVFLYESVLNYTINTDCVKHIKHSVVIYEFSEEHASYSHINHTLFIIMGYKSYLLC